MSMFTSIITANCDAAFEVSSATDRVAEGRGVLSWTSEFTSFRKRLQALRRRNQRTRNDCVVESSKKYTSDYL